MPKSSYQTYTSETSIAAFRDDFIHREAICVALAKRQPELVPVAAEAREIVGAIDGRRASLAEAEDALTRAKALESAQKVDTVDVYATLRGLVGVYDKPSLASFLPEPPSSLDRLGAKDVRGRVAAALEALRGLPDGASRYAELITALEAELAQFAAADEAEDTARTHLRAVRLALMLYRSELAAVRDRQLGTIQAVLKDRSRVGLFTLPWRKTGAARASDEEAEAPAPAPAPAEPA